MTIRVENYDAQPPGGYAVAIFDIYMIKSSMTLRRMKLCLSKKGHHFLGYPSFSEDVDGEKKWTPFYGFSEEKKKEFEKLVMDELQGFIRQPQASPPRR